jgi:hypothetical protein
MTDQELYEILGYQPKSFAEGGFTNEQVASYIRDNKLDAAGAQKAAQSFGVSAEQLKAAQDILGSSDLSGVNAATQAYKAAATPAQDAANRDFATQQGLTVAPAFDQAAQYKLAAQFAPLFTSAAAKQTATATPAATSITKTLDNAGLVNTDAAAQADTFRRQQQAKEDAANAAIATTNATAYQTKLNKENNCPPGSNWDSNFQQCVLDSADKINYESVPSTVQATDVTTTLDNAGLVSTAPSALPVQDATTGRMVADQSGEGTGSVFQAYTPEEAALYNKPIPKPIGGPAGATLVPMIGSAQTTTGAGDNVEVTSGSPQLTGYAATIGNMHYYYKPDGTFLYAKPIQTTLQQAQPLINMGVMALTAGLGGGLTNLISQNLGVSTTIAKALGDIAIGTLTNGGDVEKALKGAALGYGLNLGADQISGTLNQAFQDGGMSAADAAAATKAAIKAGTSVATAAASGANIPQSILTAGLGAATSWAADQSGLTGPAKAVFTNTLNATLRGKDISVPGVFMAAMNGAKTAATGKSASTGTGGVADDFSANYLLSEGQSRLGSDTMYGNLTEAEKLQGLLDSISSTAADTLSSGTGSDTFDRVSGDDTTLLDTFDRVSGDDTTLTDEQLAAIAAGVNANTATSLGDPLSVVGENEDDELGWIDSGVVGTDYTLPAVDIVGKKLTDDGAATEVGTILAIGNECPDGYTLNADGISCDLIKATDIGVISVKGDETDTVDGGGGNDTVDGGDCKTGYIKNASGECVLDKTCGTGYEWDETAGKCVAKLEPVTIIGTPTPCGDGTVWDDDANDGEGGCVPVKTDTVDGGCGLGFHPDPVTGLCVEDDDEGCGEGFHPDPVTGLCVEDECPDGMVRNLATGECEDPDTVDCPDGMVRNLNTGECETPTEDCPPGQIKDENGKCYTPIDKPPPPKPCPEGQSRNAAGVCVPIVKPPPPKKCPPGQVKDADGNCVPIIEQPSTETGGGGGEPGYKPGDVVKAREGAAKDESDDTLEELLAALEGREPVKKSKQKAGEKAKMATGGTVKHGCGCKKCEEKKPDTTVNDLLASLGFNEYSGGSMDDLLRTIR